MINQKKCEHCNNWTDGDKAFCDTCGGILDYKYRKERDDLEKEFDKISSLSSQNISEKLKQKFVNETPLKLITTDADLSFTGKILSYDLKPAAVQGDQTNALNRLTITMEIVFENKKATDKNFTKTFSNNIDFNATDNFQAREAELSGKVVDMLVQDIFNAAFINW